MFKSLENRKLTVKVWHGHSKQSKESQRLFKLKVDSGKLKVGFTLAEVLITLVIIGVVAAITVPMLMNDTNDKQYVVGMQKARATIGEALRLATVNGEISPSDNDTNTAEKFVKNVLPKYLKIAKSCDSATDCGFSSKVKRPDGTEMDWPDKYSDTTSTKVADLTRQPKSPGDGWGPIADYTTMYNSTNIEIPYYFQTLDGFSVKLFYNPNCAVNYKDKYRNYDTDGNYGQNSTDTACFNATYDMNGRKGPNQVGKDIGFVGSFYNGYEAKTSAVLPYKEDISKTYFTNKGFVSNGDYWQGALNYCSSIHDNDWTMPDLNELSLIYLNNVLVHGLTDGKPTINRWFWTRTPLKDSYTRMSAVYFHETQAGYRSSNTRTNADTNGWVRCVRNTAL